METQTRAVPAHVPADRVFDIDLYTDPDLKTDMHTKLAALHEKYPAVFYTPRSGGYWIVTSQALIQQVVSDSEHFSTRQQQIPPVNPPLTFLPLSLDPPAHTPYRMALMRYFGPRNVATMTDTIRALAADLVRQAAQQDRFEFLRLVGAGLPVTVFMNLMGLPLERFDEFRDLVCEFFSVIPESRRHQIFQMIEDEMAVLIEDRRRELRNDLISMLLDEKINDRKFTIEELKSMAVLLFVAGLDTVANAAAFIFYYLAKWPEMQKAACCGSFLHIGFHRRELANVWRGQHAANRKEGRRGRQHRDEGGRHGFRHALDRRAVMVGWSKIRIRSISPAVLIRTWCSAEVPMFALANSWRGSNFESC